MALSVAEIKRFMSDDLLSDRKRLAMTGKRYYDGIHDIMNARLFYYNADGKLVEDTTRANIKISHAFFTMLCEQLTYHLLSFKENPIQAIEAKHELQKYLDEYFNNKFWSEVGELVTGAYGKGFEYLYAYKNRRNKTAFECADCVGVIEVAAKDADDGKDHVIHWYVDKVEKGKKTVKRIEDWDADEIRYWIQVNDGKIVPDKYVPINPRPHVVGTDRQTGEKKKLPGYGFIPFWRLDNNKQQKSGLFAIKGQIDDYDRHACALSNNLIDFDTPLYFVTGYPGTDLDELQQNLKTKKIVAGDTEGGIDVKTVEIPYEARKEKLRLDKEAIFMHGMGFDPTLVGDGNITNVVIQSRYALLEMKAKKMQDRLCAFLEEIVPVVLDEINKEHETDYQITDIEFNFDRDTITNVSENIANAKVEAETKQIEINNILNVAANVGDDQTLKAICTVMDWDYEKLKGEVDKMNEPQNTFNAAATLAGVEPVEI